MIKMKRGFKIVMAVAVIMVFMAAGIQATAYAAEAKGAKLPADGGEPGKAYMAFIKAIREKDFAGVRKWHSGAAMETDDNEIAKGIEFMSDTADKNTKISGGYATADLATLYVSFMADKEKQYGEIEMIRNKNNVWQVGKQSWSNTPPEKK